MLIVKVSTKTLVGLKIMLVTMLVNFKRRGLI
ncbi:hypothetical protein [Salmonella phage SD-15_S21]|nr:hypothetical protein [Salmonella phage SD-15_S21]